MEEAMPVGFTVTGRTVEVLLTGKFTPREAEAAIVSGLRSGGLAPMYLLVEMHPIAPPKPDEVETAAGMIASLRGSLAAHCAFVVPDDAYAEAVRSLGQRVAPLGLEVGAFRELAAARSWLNEQKPGH
jgi:hypothetical protein